MALDYSKLTDEELQAIANDDYTKLSDRTLRLLSRDPSAKTAPQPSAQSVLGGTESSANKVASRAALADTLLNAVTSTWDLAARVPATAYYYATGPKGETFGQAYERAAEEVARTAPIKPDLVGRTLGITNTPQYSGALQRRAAEAIAPVIQENVIQPVAQATGLPEGAVADIGAIASIPLAGPTGRAVTAVARPVVNVAKATPGAVRDVAGGAYGAFTGKTAAPGAIPEPWQQPSVRQPVGKEYYTPEQIAAWRAGELPTEQLTPQPIKNLGPEALAALQKTEGNIPYVGQGFRAFGEQLGETYRNPLNLLTDVGLDVLTSGGLPTMGRMGYKAVKGGQGVKAATTLERQGFTPMYPEEFAAIKSGQPHPSVITQPVAGPVAAKPQPVATPTVTAQPVAPEPLPQLTYSPTPSVMYGSETGIVGKTPQEVVTADLAQRYAPQPVAPVAAETVTAPAVDVAAEQAASQAAKQKVLDMINAKRAQQPQPEVPATTVTPVEPTALPTTPEEMFGLPAKQTTLSTGEGFSNKIEQHRQGLINDRQARNMPAPDITDAAVVKSMIKQTGNGAVTQSGKRVSVNTALYDDFAKEAGAKLDWTTAPDVTGLDRPATRTAINDWIYNSVKEQRPDLELGSRGPQMRTVQKQAEAELGITGKETSTAEELAALERRAKLLLGNKFKTPTNKPSGTMEMMTGLPEFKSKQAFLEQKMMNDLAGKPTVGTFPEGNKKIVYETESVGPFEMMNVTEFDAKTNKKLGPTKRISMKKVK